MSLKSILEKALLLLGAIALNLGLYLLVPYIQILILKNTQSIPKSPKQVTTELTFTPQAPEKLVKREIKEIKLQAISSPQATPSRPSTPGGGLKIDLSPAGGEGLALLSGGDRTGGIGSGTGGGTGSGISAVTYEAGQTDVDAKPINDPPLNFPPRAKREDKSGMVELAFIVNEGGMVERITILKEEPTGYGFANMAIQSANKLRFKPASLQKMAVRQHVKRTFRFSSENQ